MSTPVNWTIGTQGVLPPSGIEGGREADGRIMVVARAPYAGGLHPGKATAELVHISYDGNEIVVRGYFELLVGDETSVRWAPVQGPLSAEDLGASLVRGGQEADGEILYIAQAPVSGGVHCGKVKIGGQAHIPYAGKEVIATGYNVLVYA